jgi:hypothetical protein
MNFIFQLVSMLAAVVIILTITARLNDNGKHASGPGLLNHVRHHGLIVAHLGIAGGAVAVILIVLTGRVPSVPNMMFCCGIALRQLTHPDSWWEFVIRGRPYILCQKRTHA